MILIGLMSGTSADGVDAAVVRIDGRTRLRWSLLGHTYVPWSAGERAAILNACRATAPLQEIVVLSAMLGEGFARAAQKAAAECGVPLEGVTAIASHGQTVWHQPEPMVVAGHRVTGTMQIGEPAIIAARTGCAVIADFRPADLALGGQGAPLAPLADYLLFSSRRETRAVLNLGGIANVTLLPAGTDCARVIAFDTGPANMVIDAFASRVTGGAQECDENGRIAERGQVDRSLLAEMLDHPYFHRPPPKSTGREAFGSGFVDKFWARGDVRTARPEDLLATATALTAATVAEAIRRWLVPLGPTGTVIAGGGGTRNPVLMRMLAESVAPARLMTHADFGIPDAAKEALAFALIAHETIAGRPGNLPSATGASGPAVPGKVVFPPQGGGRLHLRRQLDSRRGVAP